MKKKLTRMLAVVLIAMMLIPTLATFAVSAEGETEETIDISDIVNLYKLRQLDAAPPMGSKVPKEAEPTFEEGMLASEPFDVTRTGDKYLYIGPCPDPRIEANWKKLDYIVYWYKKDGTYTSQKKLMDLGNLNSDGVTYGNIVGEFADGSVILKIMISSTYKYAAIKVPTTYSEYMLVTSERSFTVEEYYAYADSQGWDIESVGLRPAIADEAPERYEGLWNFFPRLTDRDPLLRQHQNTTYVESEYIPVTGGDVITMGAISTSETKTILTTYNADLDKVRDYKRVDYGIDFEEELAFGFGIYSFVVPEGVTYIKASVHSGIYNDGDILVTRNQPFTGAELNATLGIDELSEEAKSHAFYGKDALFVGDSISYGSYDTPPTYRNPSASWARRLALATGLNPTNVSYPGASVGKTGLPNVKWEYDLLKTALMSKTEYDMVVFQGGVNDARQNVAVGTALSSDTDRKILVEEDRVATFAGGLQLMFHDAREKWPEAEFYYIANFKLVPDSVKGKDMNEYFAQAKILCAEYGVHYIDLYNNVELYEVFDYESYDLLPDLIHPISSTYDLLFPTILNLFNETLEEKEEDEPVIPDTPDVPAEPEETTPEVTTPEESTPEETTPEETTPEESTPEEPTPEEPTPEETTPEETTPEESTPEETTPEETTPEVTTPEVTTPEETTPEEEEHVCENVTGWKAFWNSIMNFFRRLFGQPELCDCGETVKKKN